MASGSKAPSLHLNTPYTRPRPDNLVPRETETSWDGPALDEPDSLARASTAARKTRTRTQPAARSTRGAAKYRPTDQTDDNGADAATNPPPAPKPARKQFSACGACRHRQVRCDLKDITLITPPGEEPRCTNCAERGMNCVDEYAGAKKAKAHRRGRRLKAVEEVYGKSESVGRTEGNIDTPSSSSFQDIAASGAPALLYPYQDPPLNPSRQQSVRANLPIAPPAALPAVKKSCIPPLQPDFFHSAFYRRFHVQRPIVDPKEFSSRFLSAVHGQPNALGPIGMVIASVLVTWAASYGIDEHGKEEDPLPRDGPELLAAVKQRREVCNEMVRELLGRIDALGLLRRPSWDGVRVLLLIMPLTEDILTPLDRLSMYQSTVSQIYNLCTVGTSVLKSGNGVVADKLVIARIFWYTYVHEGITSGLRGRKLIFDDDDRRAFEATLPKLPSPGQPTSSLTQTNIVMSVNYRFVTAPIRLSTACRHINEALTGPKAQKKRHISEAMLNESWEMLAACWEEFESLRELELGGIMQREDMERFVSGWQIFLFECHNVIRETLKARLIEQTTEARSAQIVELDEHNARREHPSNIEKLHELAESHCRDLAVRVINRVREQLDSPSFFQYDASLVRDGTFYAGHWACHDLGSDEDIDACKSALEKMRWAFSFSETRIETLVFARNRRISDDLAQRQAAERRAQSFGFNGLSHNAVTPSLSAENRGFQEESANTFIPAPPSHHHAPDPFQQFLDQHNALAHQTPQPPPFSAQPYHQPQQPQFFFPNQHSLPPLNIATGPHSIFPHPEDKPSWQTMNHHPGYNTQPQTMHDQHSVTPPSESRKSSGSPDRHIHTHTHTHTHIPGVNPTHISESTIPHLTDITDLAHHFQPTSLSQFTNSLNSSIHDQLDNYHSNLPRHPPRYTLPRLNIPRAPAIPGSLLPVTEPHFANHPQAEIERMSDPVIPSTQNNYRYPPPPGDREPDNPLNLFESAEDFQHVFGNNLGPIGQQSLPPFLPSPANLNPTRYRHES